MKEKENYLEQYNQICDGDVAIIGMAGRFPKARNLDAYWQNLRDGKECISLFSDEDLTKAGIDTKLLSEPNYVKAGFVLEDAELFDTTFFGYSPREAEILDPQQRVFLESAWEAMENAGYNTETYQGQISIYASSSINTYFLFNLFANSDLVKLVGFDQIRHNNRVDNISTRVAYKLNLNGAAVTVQTGCSSSLVAIHLGCQSLLNQECDIALAGGVSISALQKRGYLYQEGGILSPDGHCRAFDVEAKGTVNGNGVGVVVLKRLKDAIESGDYIHAVIKGSAVNNDGSLKVGYTAPSVDGQAKVIAEALAVSGVHPETVGYVEAHGTGTVLGDPIEITALSKCFGAKTQKKNFCAIGSVKTNIGHLDVAAGVAGLLKTVLALKHKQIPPSLHFKAPNPQINFTDSPFYVNNQLSEWHSVKHPRRAGVSSFGIGGTNAHVILEEPPTVTNYTTSRQWQLLLLSAKTPTALENAIANLAQHLKQNPNLNLADVAYTLCVGRRNFEYRCALVCQNTDDAIQVLETQVSQNQRGQKVFTQFQESGHPPVVFMFPGQGSQYPDMGRELYETEFIFRSQVDYCCELLLPHLGLDLRQVIYENTAQQLTQTAITQPALFVIEYALAKLWMAWGVHPEAMIGHSIGEYVAACLAGVFSLEDALSLVATRGKLMQQLPSGKMLAVFLPESEVKPLLNENLAIAANNAPCLCVVSGTHEAIDILHEQLTAQGVDRRPLHTSHAFHSPMMQPIIQEWKERVALIKLNTPQKPFISNVTGTWITASQATDPNYWAKHLRQTVRFSDGVVELLKTERLFLEVGPGRTLTGLVRQHPHLKESHILLNSLRHPQEQQSDGAFLLNTLGRLWLAGIEVKWSSFYTSERRHRIPLPTYPFERQKFWIEPQAKVAPVTDNQWELQQSNIADWFYVPVWKSIPLQPVSNETKQKLCWLVFIDECGLSTLLVEQLEQQGQDVITVQVGEQFTKLRDSVYCINPQTKDDYDALFQDLRVLNKTPQMIAHFWESAENNQIPLDIDSWEIVHRGFWSLLFLAQALEKLSITDTVQINVVTNNTYNITGEENLYPEKATVIGACKVIGQEFLNITCRHIDVVIPAERQQKKLIDRLMSEFTLNSKEFIVAYRGSHRWVQTFEALPLEKASQESQLRQGGVYLITGGLGGIGLALAEYLAKTVQAKLVLIGRSYFPCDAWEQWLASHESEDAISQKIQKLQALEKLGAEVLVISADVTNLEQMRAVKNQVMARFGEIHGVIHAAGVAGSGIIQLKTPQTATNVLAPKVKGTKVLDALFRDEKLDFLVLCSSLTSIVGGFGQVDYCAANAFLDYFAHSNSYQQKPLTISINWCGWQEVGMLVNTSVPSELKERREQHIDKGILPQEGVEVFSRILHSGLPQVIVSKQNLQEQIKQSYAKILLAEENINSTKSLHPRPQLTKDYVAPRTDLEKTISEIWQQIFGLEQIGIYDNFFELGGHSLLATQVVSKLRKTFMVEIPLSSLFSEDSSIAQLAETVEQLVLEKVEELSEEEVQRLLGV